MINFQSPRIMIIVVMCVLVHGNHDARAQNCCFNYDWDCCHCCSEHILTCSECAPPSTFSCCPIIWGNMPVPKRIFNQASGWRIGTSVVVGLGAVCRIEYQSADCEEEDCIPVGFKTDLWCTTDIPPDKNCPPC